MRKFFAIAALGFLTLALPALALALQNHEADQTPGSGQAGVRVDCPGDVVWDTGMFDEYTPPAGCSTAGSAGCFVNAENAGAFPPDGRRIADDFVAISDQPITGVKIWARYNDLGYAYHLANDGLHGFCVKFYEMTPDFWCPDGSRPGETAIGEIVYDEYLENFVEEEIFTGLVRNFNACITLDPPFIPTVDMVYWVSVSADFDFTVDATQWFWRQYPGLGISFCESSWWDTWNTPNTDWQAISVALNIPCWAGWDAAFVLYAGEVQPQEGACCLETGECIITTRDLCNAQGGEYQGDNVPCDPYPCEPVATQESTWGAIKANFR